MRRCRDMLLLALGVMLCVSVLIIVSGSVKSGRELTDALGPVLGSGEGMLRWKLFPLYPTLRHYGRLLLETPEFYTVFWNSVKLTAGILGGRLLVATPMAWAFARFSFPGKRLLFTLYVILMLLPFQVTMLPSYLVLDRLHLMNTHAAVILPAVFSTFPVFLMYRGFSSIPKECLEAAKIDGAGELKTFLYIGVPLGSTGILTSLVLGFLECWNLIEQPLAFLAEPSLWPLSLYLPEIGLTRAGLAMAASAVLLLPAGFVFLMGQERLAAAE